MVQLAEFETADPTLQGAMAITYRLAPDGDGTTVTGTHEGLPPGLSPEENATGWAMSMRTLARLVEEG